MTVVLCNEATSADVQLATGIAQSLLAAMPVENSTSAVLRQHTLSRVRSVLAVNQKFVHNQKHPNIARDKSAPD